MTKHDRIDLIVNDEEVVVTDPHRDEHLVDSLLLAVKEDRPPQADQKVGILLHTNFSCIVYSESCTEIKQFTQFKCPIVPIHQIQINVNCTYLQILHIFYFHLKQI